MTSASILEAYDLLHALGAQHRDLEPRHIRSRDGVNVNLIDFEGSTSVGRENAKQEGGLVRTLMGLECGEVNETDIRGRARASCVASGRERRFMRKYLGSDVVTYESLDTIDEPCER